MATRARPHVGTLREGPLHAALKDWYREPGDLVEHPVEGFLADIVRGDVLIEVQTSGFSSMGRKPDRLGCGRRLAQQMTFCLRLLDLVATVGKRGNTIVYRRSAAPRTSHRAVGA